MLNSEIDLYGVFVPSLLVMMLLAYALTSGVRRLLALTGIYSLVWHRSLFNFSLYILVLAGLVALAR
ncbi:conserved exported protein of unknown function (plasmid) [Cupriavidus taiwanensis]|uniref:Protein AaeX n=1 Tax=Cupriavidus taiwanensis TaxID=164546 RepID=A0A375IMP5_9BURK|nr:DUF1656 domain-containing protein [Cupriavidus taiwanensis]SPK75963.1 conserved exported protein of unknown function [Cupriavidus taiwanensis]